jgi:hypothetical protein
MKVFKVPATLEGVSTLKDGGLSCRFHTQELSPEDKTKAFEFQQGYGWLLFQEQDYKQDELDLEEIRKDTGGKSPSQRMRSVLYILYNQSGQSVSFEVFYSNYMDTIIEQLKDKIK